MNVVITPTEYKPSQVYFTERRANTHIPNSIFNRITYSTRDFIMNGIYIQFELLVGQTDQNFNSNIYNCHFDTSHEHNRTMLIIFKKIEESILEKWIQVQHAATPTATPTTTATATLPGLSRDIIQQLQSGIISVWKNDMSTHEKPQFQHFIIKISGVWENEKECGLTYKFI
jgi:hypothetical protein